MEKTCENCGFGPCQIIPGVACDSFCSIMNHPDQDCLWQPKEISDEEAIEIVNKRR